MGDPGSQSGGFFSELGRRKVIRVAITYGVVGFAVVAAADVIAEAFDLPPQFVALVIVSVVLGLPVAIVLAWSYDVVPDPRSRSPLRLPLAIAAVAVLAVIGYGWVGFNGPPAAEPAAPAFRYVDSIAVMPLHNRTGDSQYDHLGSGITEEIIAHLARIAPLKVISRHSVEAVDRQNLANAEIATALGVRHIIEGTVRLDGETLRITVRHINAEADAEAWGEQYDGNISDLIAVQEDVARQVTSRVVEMIPGIQQPNYSAHVDAGPGQEAYLAGRRFLGQRTSDGFNDAIDQFNEAIELDPGFAPAYADLASAYALALIYRYDIGMDGYETAARSMALSERSLELDANLASGYAARAYLGLYVNRPAEEVAADFERAAELQPNAASIPSWRSLSLAQLGMTEEAFAEAGRAVELDPLAPSRQLAVASISFELGRFDEAIAAGRTATTLEPRLIRGRAVEARSLILSGRAADCAAMILGPHRVLRATCLYASGQQADSTAIIDNVLADIRNGKRKSPGYTEVITYEDLAIYYALRGNAKDSLFWVARAYSVSPAGIEPRVLRSALFNPIRDDPEFRTSVDAIRDALYDRVRRDSRQIL